MENYIFPPETRTENFIVPSCNIIPVVDLSKAADDHNRIHTIQQILNASKEFGLFQVIKHGVAEKLINKTMSVYKEFFEMPAEDKACVYSENPRSSCNILTSNLNDDPEKINHWWRHNLRHPCHPLEECIQHCPQKPIAYREVVGAYSVEAKRLSSMILELICEGLGLESGYFADKLSQNCVSSANYYPPCPEPSLALGLPIHCDPNLITILLQGEVSGLQVFKDGEWIGVEPLPNAFVINIGYALQVISNNKLKSAEHRAVPNSKDARICAAFFVSPTADSIIEPAKPLTDSFNRALYRACQYQDFLTNYICMDGNTEVVLEPYKLQI